MNTTTLSRFSRALLGIAGSLALLAGAAAPMAAAHAAGQAGAATSASCTASGGTAARMRPYGFTDAPAENWLQFGEDQIQVCTYTAADGSRIAIRQATLDSPNITTAAYAYYAKQPFKPVDASNPGAQYCKQVGGATLIGDPMISSGWASKPGKDAVVMCVFADGSAIDAMGLFYYAQGAVRGIDLGTVLKYPNPF